MNCPNVNLTLFSKLIIFLFILDLPSTISVSSNFHNDLKHVHVIFAHKFYAPLESRTEYGFPKKLDFEYFLANTFDMPNEAKMEIYQLGVYLRRRYNDFLGDIYYSEVLKMQTSEYFLSMISGQLLNAGLWPPAELQKWNDDLDWQPIPSDYTPMENDTLFLGTLCPHFLDEEKRLLATDESIKNEVSVHEPLFNYVSRHYGEKIERPSDISMLYSSLESIASDREFNRSLPTWAEGIFPDGEMRNVTLLSYDLLSRSNSQKQLNGGVFLKRIIEESMKIVEMNNNNNSHRVNGNDSRDFKLSMYSAEDRNVIGILQAMNLWWSPHLLENGASVMLEFRYNKSAEEYGFEVYYYTGVTDNETIGLTVPGCENFCPLRDFVRILDEVVPSDENILCHVKLPIDERSSANSHRYYVYPRRDFVSSLVLSLLLLLLLFVTY